MWRIAAALIFLAAFFLSEPRRSLVVCGSASAENELCTSLPPSPRGSNFRPAASARYALPQSWPRSPLLQRGDVVGDGRPCPIPRADVVRDSVTSGLRLSVAMELREAARNQTIGDIIGPARDFSDLVNAVSDQIIFGELDDFHSVILFKPKSRCLAPQERRRARRGNRPLPRCCKAPHLP